MVQMRPAALLGLLAAATLVAAVFVLRAGAQESGATVYVSGIEIGRKDRALVRFHNASTFAGDVYSVNYTVRHTDAGQPLSFPGAGDGARLRPGETIELDLGPIVNTYRAGLELGEFDGPVQLVAFGSGGIMNEFGPDTVIVQAIQKDGGASFAPLVEWR